jgi:hypothetical protein
MMLCKVNLSRIGRAYRQRKCFQSRASVLGIDEQTTGKDDLGARPVGIATRPLPPAEAEARTTTPV